MRWEAPSRGFAYCFEQQPLPGARRQGVCVQQEFPAKSSHLENSKRVPETPRFPPALARLPRVLVPP